MIETKLRFGWYIPEEDTQLEHYFNSRKKKYTYDNKRVYEPESMRLFCDHIPDHRLRGAVDVGSHIGLWTYILADKFDFVHCFEPMELHRSCWHKNISKENTKLYPFALGSKTDRKKIISPFNVSVATYIDGYADMYKGDKHSLKSFDIDVRKLDDFYLSGIDLIKIDVQGYELEVLKGGVDTIIKEKPYILIEEDVDNLPSVNFLKNLGMKYVDRFKINYLLGW